MQSRTLLILTLLLYLSQNVISQGVTPIQRSPDFSHFNAEPIHLVALTQIGTSEFTNTANNYTMLMSLQKESDIASMATVLLSYQSMQNYTLAYKVQEYTLTNPASQVYLNLTLLHNSTLSKISFSILIVSTKFEPFLQFFEIPLNVPYQYTPITCPDFSNTQFIVLTRSFQTIWVGSIIALVNQNLGFTTLSNRASPFFNLAYAPEPFSVQADISEVIYTVLVVNSLSFKQTAQFSNVEWNTYTGNQMLNYYSWSPSYYSYDHRFDSIFALPSMPQINTLQSFYTMDITTTALITTNNNLLSNYFEYVHVIFKDMICPSNAVYSKKGGDNLCYACPDSSMEYTNTNHAMTESSIVITGDSKCAEINPINAIYGFNKADGYINMVCAPCTKPKTGYFLDVNGASKTCSANCIECDSGVKCTKCATGYQIFDNDASKPQNGCKLISNPSSGQHIINVESVKPQQQSLTFSIWGIIGLVIGIGLLLLIGIYVWKKIRSNQIAVLDTKHQTGRSRSIQSSHNKNNDKVHDQDKSESQYNIGEVSFQFP